TESELKSNTKTTTTTILDNDIKKSTNDLLRNSSIFNLKQTATATATDINSNTNMDTNNKSKNTTDATIIDDRDGKEPNDVQQQGSKRIKTQSSIANNVPRTSLFSLSSIPTKTSSIFKSRESILNKNLST